MCGVPSLGLEVDVSNSLIQMAEAQANEQLVRSIQLGSELLESTHEDFKHVFSKEKFPNSAVYSVYETKETPTAKRVVSDIPGVAEEATFSNRSQGEKWEMTGPSKIYVRKQSAIASRRNEDYPEFSLAIEEDHSNLVKFQRGSKNYERILRMIENSNHKSAIDDDQYSGTSRMSPIR
jgi:hypothetical protein